MDPKCHCRGAALRQPIRQVTLHPISSNPKIRVLAHLPSLNIADRAYPIVRMVVGENIEQRQGRRGGRVAEMRVYVQLQVGFAGHLLFCNMTEFETLRYILYDL